MKNTTKKTSGRTKMGDPIMDSFLSGKEDAYIVLQLNDRDSDADAVRFISMKELERMGKSPDAGLYGAVYIATLPFHKDVMCMLEDLFVRLNMDERPYGFHGHSLSVSDVVAVRENGVVTCYYVDPVGFRELPGFLETEKEEEKEERFEIRWEDLTKDAQKELLKAFGMDNPRDLNWDVFPVATIYG